MPGLHLWLSAVYSNGATLAGTTTQFSAGAASKQAVWHYHIAEFFRIQPLGEFCMLDFLLVPGGAYTFAEITTSANILPTGTIRQIGIYKDAAAFASGDLTAIHNEIVTNNDA
jgi:hypothetical protein